MPTGGIPDGTPPSAKGIAAELPFVGGNHEGKACLLFQDSVIAVTGITSLRIAEPASNHGTNEDWALPGNDITTDIAVGLTAG